VIDKIDENVEKEEVDFASNKGITVVLQEEESDEQLEKALAEELNALAEEMRQLGEVQTEFETALDALFMPQSQDHEVTELIEMRPQVSESLLALVQKNQQEAGIAQLKQEIEKQTDALQKKEEVNFESFRQENTRILQKGSQLKKALLPHRNSSSQGTYN